LETLADRPVNSRWPARTLHEPPGEDCEGLEERHERLGDISRALAALSQPLGVSSEELGEIFERRGKISKWRGGLNQPPEVISQRRGDLDEAREKSCTLREDNSAPRSERARHANRSPARMPERCRCALKSSR
jgi:hypothetical protein